MSDDHDRRDDDEGDLDDEEIDDDDLDDEEDEEDEEGDVVRRIRIPGSARERGRKPARKPSKLALVVVMALMALGVAYGINGVMNLHAREAVIERCLAEDARLENAIAQRSELRLPISDWMVVLYQARRRYVTELCQGTIDELEWWRWNLFRSVEADISRASAQEITNALEEAANTCEDEVRNLQRGLEERISAGSGSEVLTARVREVSEGQLEACAELRRAVMHSRPGFWPAFRADSVTEVDEELERLMPEIEEEPIRPGMIDD